MNADKIKRLRAYIVGAGVGMIATDEECSLLCEAADELERLGTAKQWQDAPTKDDLCWIQPNKGDATSQYPWRFKQPRYVELIHGEWLIHVPSIGGGAEPLNNRRVCPIGGPPE